MRALLVLFVVVPLVELYLLTLLARATSFWVAVALTLVTGVLGGSLAKREGLRVWRRWQQSLNEMKMPEEGVIGGLLVLVGGVLLITPGILTDISGFLLLIPATRRFVAERIRARVSHKFSVTQATWPPLSNLDSVGSAVPPHTPNTIDTSGTSVDP